MFIRKKKNKSGSVSIQIISKSNGQYKVIKTVGCAKTQREEELMILLAKTEMERLSGMQSLFIEHDDAVVDNFVDSLANDHLQVVGSELVLGKIYDKLGYPDDGCPYAQNRRAFFNHTSLCPALSWMFHMVSIQHHSMDSMPLS